MQPFATSAVLMVPTPFTASAACTLPLPCLGCQLCRQLFPISHVLAAGRWRGIPHPPFQAADTRGAHHPTQRQLIKVVCLNLPSLPAHTNKLCHPYLWLQFFTNTRALGMAQKHFFCGPWLHKRGQPQTQGRSKAQVPKTKMHLTTTVFTSDWDVKEKGVNHDKREKCRICSEVLAAG